MESGLRKGYRGGARRSSKVGVPAFHFLNLLDIHGPPPRVIWITMGNTSNAHMRAVLDTVFAQALVSLREGESIVEITDVIR
jgi:predicted nuclease of predicted toxin-antitoxin system